ncbi:hypothetical protein A9W98_04270 [Mycobacterium gordonae]|uniref:Uncharacterized protein n=1 Tax=Mycobacterium gordonae TaxID=1778 RepID=A0A1A6B6S3_MYCGO|nr:hypothetical protein A9W98_04270 [Mycobacterium gordonae]
MVGHREVSAALHTRFSRREGAGAPVNVQPVGVFEPKHSGAHCTEECPDDRPGQHVGEFGDPHVAEPAGAGLIRLAAAVGKPWWAENGSFDAARMRARDGTAKQELG